MPKVSPTDNPPNNGHQDDDQPPADISPIVMGRPGRPSFSLEALRERIERQFKEETADRPDIVSELDTEAKQRELLAEVAEYVLAVEAVTLSERDKRALLDKAHRNLFTFGPLDPYLQDDAITEITVNGPRSISVRRGMGKLEPADAAFDDPAHLQSVVERALAAGGVVLSEIGPFLETGVTLVGRPVRLGLIAPPVSPHYTLEIRLHPPNAVTLDDLVSRYRVMSEQAAALLKAVLAAGHGLLIVGEAGLGKTTLAGALAATLPENAIIRAVERAAELRLPAHIQRHAATPPTPDQPGCDFVCRFQEALAQSPDWLIADEIRVADAAAVAEALLRDAAPRYLWVFRGDSQPDRLRSALSMVIRKQTPGIEQAAINRALARHVPFVAALKSVGGKPSLPLIAEWNLGDGDDAPLALRPLLVEHDGGWVEVQPRPARALDLPDEFWA